MASFKSKIREMKHFLRQNRFILLVLFVTLLFRLPSLFEPYWYGDEGIYLTIGLALRKGFLLYRDVFDNKPPLFYLLPAAVNGTIFWFRFLLFSSVLASIYFFYQMSQKLLSGKEIPAKAVTVIFAALTTLRLLEGNIANAEIFILLPTVLGLFLVFSNQKEKPFLYFLAGLLLGLGFLLKLPALFDFLALMVFLLFFTGGKIIKIGRKEILLVLGYLLPFVFTCLFFWLKGILGLFLNSAIVQTFGYLSSWKTGSHVFSLIALLKTDLAIKGTIILSLLFLFWILRKKLLPAALFVFIWLLFSLFGATLSGRPYPHYLVQIIPPLTLLAGLIFLEKKKTITLIAASFFLLLGLTLYRYRFWYYPTISYYQNFAQFALGQKTKNDYFSYFGKNVPALYRLGQIIDTSSLPNEKIFIWADEPSIYALSRRLPATPYLVAYHILDLHREEKTLTKLEANKPKLIIVDEKMKRLPSLVIFIQNNYLEMKSMNNFTVYLKRGI